MTRAALDLVDEANLLHQRRRLIEIHGEPSLLTLRDPEAASDDQRAS